MWFHVQALIGIRLGSYSKFNANDELLLLSVFKLDVMGILDFPKGNMS